MKIQSLIISILIFCTYCNGQENSTKYYSSSFLDKEVQKEKGKYSKTIIQNSNGTITTEVKNLKKDQVISSRTYKGDEPFGVWIYQSGNGIKELDYNFSLKYSEENCADTTMSININDYFLDVDSVNYIAPKVANQENVYQFISNNLIYPLKAREEGIQGKVFITLTVNMDGNIENIIVKRGVNVELDKEAVRVLQKLKFVSSAILNGQKRNICFTFPISFTMV